MFRHHHHVHILYGSFFNATSSGSNHVAFVFSFPVALKQNSNRGSLIFFMFLDHTQLHTQLHTHTHTHTVDMTPPNTSSAHCKGRYLHNTHTRDEHHAVSGIRTRVSSTLGVAYLRVKLHGHQDRHRVLDDEIRRPLCLSPLGWQYSK